MPTMILPQSLLDHLEQELPQMLRELRERFTLETSEFAGESRAQAVAQSAASTLEESCLSSDIDTPYWPCVLVGLGKHPWAALGIERSAKVKLSGWEAPKLELREVSAVQALGNLSDEHLVLVDSYLVQEDQERFHEVGEMLSSHGALINLRLAFPEESAKLLFVGAPVGDELAGVVSFAVET